MRFITRAASTVDITMLRVAGVGPEASLLLALVIYDGYELFPASPNQKILKFPDHARS
jgi:hypothetical protein